MIPLDPTTVPLSGTSLIEASAGTGKTYTITTLYVRLLLERQLPVAEILVVTYTNAATAELRARIRRRVREALAALDTPGGSGDTTLDQLLKTRRAHVDSDRRVLTAALCSFDEAAIFTIHGFCQRMLQENAFESGVPFDTRLVTDQTALQDEVLHDFWTRELHAAPEVFVRHLRRRGMTLAKLAGLAYKSVAQPDMPVVPDAPAIDLNGPAFTEKLAAWRAAHAQATSIWTVAREQILDALCDASSLKASMYKPEVIRTQWAPRMEIELAAGQPGLCARFDKFMKFTTSGLTQGTKKNCTPPAHPFFTACDTLMSVDMALEHDLDGRLLQLRLDLVRYARDEVRRRKAASHTQSFDDLLHRLRDALEGAGGDRLAAKIRGRFRAALIDEFQDTDPVQYQIFRRIYHRREAVLFLIGDPKQAIYAFRGADVFTYIDAKADVAEAAEGGNEYTLQTNWRSGPRLLHAINALFSRARAQFVFTEIPFWPMQPAPKATEALGGAAPRAPLQFLFVQRSAGAERINKGSSKDLLAAAVAAEIVRLVSSAATIDGQPIGPGDIAVLCRTNEQARSMQQALRELRMPSVLQGDASVFDAPEALDLERVLRAMADPGDLRALRAALSTTLMGLRAEELWALRGPEHAWDLWVERFQRWHAVWVEWGFMPAFRRMLDEHRVSPLLLERVDGERRLTNVLHLGELLQTAGLEAQRGPLALVEWMRVLRNDVTARGDVVGDAAQIRLESDARAVKLVTIHKSKGLEYPIVFCPYLWDGLLLRGDDKECVRFHDRDDANRLKLDLAPGSPDGQRHLEQAKREALAENLRLLYVALTRAKHHCSVVWGKFTHAESSPLGYVLHQPRTLPDDAEIAAVTRSRIASLDDDALLADLQALAASADGAIEIVDLPLEAGTPYEPAGEEERELNCRATQRRLHAGWRASSFSALVSSAGRVSVPAQEGVDHDDVADEAARSFATPGSSDPTRPPEASGVRAGSDRIEPPTGGCAALVPLHDFPGGTQSGQLIHEIFQHHDFRQRDSGVLQALVAQRLARYGIEPRWLEPLCRAIDEVLDTPLDTGVGAPTLRQVPLRTRLNEMEFTFPVASPVAPRAAMADDDRVMLTAARLAAVFARHAAPPLPPDYAERLRRIGFEPLAGYLRGFIDLSFEHAGRWYVVDYKSNRLGASPDDYRPQRLDGAMARGHYYLQYHLYAVALHRYLSLRRRDYDYDRHFGGVYYLFVRGMSPRHAAGCGVFRDRPSRALIEDLSAVLTGPGDGCSF